MKSAVRYPDPPKSPAEADMLARILERKFGFVVIGILPTSEINLKVGDYVVELWGIAVEEDYVVKSIGELADWEAQMEFLERYYNRKRRDTVKAEQYCGKQFARVVRVKD